MSDDEFERRVRFIINKYHGREECCDDCMWFDKYSRKCHLRLFTQKVIDRADRELCEYFERRRDG